MEKKEKNVPVLTALVEMGFIIFLFYSNILMGEFTRAKMALNRDFSEVFTDVFTWTNFLIAIVASFFGHFVFTFFRKRI